MPFFVAALRNRKVFFCSIFLYVITYIAILPALITYTTGKYWAWQPPVEQQFVWMIVWGLAAM